MRSIRLVLGTLLLLATSAVAQTTIDGSMCFKTKDTAAKGTYTVIFNGQSCRVKTPALLSCLTQAGAPITPAPPVGSTVALGPTQLCYRARCRPITRQPAVLADVFGARGVTVKASRFLCLPAGGQDTIVTTTTVPGGATTTTLPQRACGFEDGECGGTCPGNQRCSIATDGGCACRATACGDADAPSCNGSCPNSDETCFFVLTGCECLDAP